MKRKVLIVLIVLSTLDLSAQFKKGDILISADGNYLKTNTEYGVTTNQNNTNGQYLQLGTSIGTFITNKFIVGVGVDYNWSKEMRKNSLSFDNAIQQEEMATKSHVILPNLYFGYYQRIIDKLYFSGTLRFSYGKVKSEYQTIYGGVSNPQGFTNGTSTSAVGTQYTEFSIGAAESDYFGTEVCPELTYFVSTKLGLCLGLGGVQYSLTDWKTDSSNWIVNFNPSYWTLGIKLKI